MAVKEFIGARYITKFANPIQWDSTRAYEAIEAVQNNGFTYISKQPVPVGVEITNEDFWLLWADPNAQMEQLRQIVETYDERINDNAEEIENVKTNINAAIPIGNVRRYGAIENSIENDWQAIFEAASLEGNKIDFGGGKWIFTEGITVPINIAYIIGNNANIIVRDNISTLFTIQSRNTTNERPFKIDGINFSGEIENEEATIDIFIKVPEGTGNVAHISNSVFRVFNECAIDATGAIGAFINNCMFFNQEDEVKNKATAIKSATDNVINGCKFFHMHMAVDAASAEITGCYIFNPSVDGNASYGVGKTGTYTSRYTVLNTEFDGVTHCVLNPRNVQLAYCEFIYTKSDIAYTGAHSIFRLEGRELMRNIVFSHNVLSCPVPFGNKIYSFTAQAASANNQVLDYVSEGNIFNPESDISAFAILCGFNRVQFARGCTENDPHVTEFIYNQSGNYNSPPSINIEAPQRFAWFKQSSQLVQIVNFLRTTLTGEIVKAFTLKSGAFPNNGLAFITIPPSSIRKIEYSGALLNMDWTDKTTIPSEDSYNVFTTNIIS